MPHMRHRHRRRASRKMHDYGEAVRRAGGDRPRARSSTVDVARSRRRRRRRRCCSPAAATSIRRSTARRAHPTFERAGAGRDAYEIALVRRGAGARPAGPRDLPRHAGAERRAAAARSSRTSRPRCTRRLDHHRAANRRDRSAHDVVGRRRARSLADAARTPEIDGERLSRSTAAITRRSKTLGDGLESRPRRPTA